MIIFDLEDLPKEVYVVTAITFSSESTYHSMSTIATSEETLEEAERTLESWQKTFFIIDWSIERRQLNISQDELRNKAIDTLNRKKQRIMADKQMELDQVDEAIQNLLALPAPDKNDGDVFDD